MLLRLRWIHAAALLDRLARIVYVTTYYLRSHYPNAWPATFLTANRCRTSGWPHEQHRLQLERIDEVFHGSGGVIF